MAECSTNIDNGNTQSILNALTTPELLMSLIPNAEKIEPAKAVSANSREERIKNISILLKPPTGEPLGTNTKL